MIDFVLSTDRCIISRKYPAENPLSCIFMEINAMAYKGMYSGYA